MSYVPKNPHTSTSLEDVRREAFQKTKFEREQAVLDNPPTRGWFGTKTAWRAHLRRYYFTCGFKGWGKDWEPIWNEFQGCRERPWTHPVLKLCDECFKVHTAERKTRNQRKRRDVDSIRREYEANLLGQADRLVKRAKSVDKLRVNYLHTLCPKCDSKEVYPDIPEQGKRFCRGCKTTFSNYEWNVWHELKDAVREFAKALEGRKETEKLVADLKEALRADNARYQAEHRARKRSK